MHVARVELENIKSYEHADYRFERGTTAITGENGSGKTTILEAIAWALFDTLEYSKTDFLRRGANRGSVRVTFESDLDERQYTVYRDTLQGYFIYDHSLGIRIAEKKVDVSATLRRLLGIEPGTDVKALFSSAIGVPQGTFTADFLRPANQRKAAFDRLLKVEEYRDGADRLLGTAHLIRDRMTEVRVRIAGAEGQLVRFDELANEYKAASKFVDDLTEEASRLKKEIAERTETITRMDEVELQVIERRAALDRLQVRRDEAVRRVEDLRIRHAASVAAAARLREVQADHLAHLSAVGTLAGLEADRKQRDILKAQVEENSRQCVASQMSLLRLQEGLERAVQAKTLIESLKPKIKVQEEVERERERLRDLRSQALSSRERLSRVEAEIKALRTQHSQTQKRIKDAQGGEGAQSRLNQLESERSSVQTRLSEIEKALTSLKHLEDQRKQALMDTERLRTLVTALEGEIKELSKYSKIADKVHPLEASEQKLTDEIANLKAGMERDDKFYKEVKEGLCPILSQKCLNIPEGETLENYFETAFATNRALVKLRETERRKVSTAVLNARDAEKQFSRVDSIRKRLAEEKALLADRETMLATCEAAIAALPKSTVKEAGETAARLGEVDVELKRLRADVLRFAEIPTLMERLIEITQEGKRKREEQASILVAVEGLPEIENKIAEVESELRRLEDPRGRIRSLQPEAAQEEDLSHKIATASASDRELCSRAEILAGKLAQYSNLDFSWENTCKIRDRTLQSHREYLANESFAQALALTEQEFTKAEAEAAQLLSEAETIKAKLDAAIQKYDPKMHAAERAALLGAKERAAAIGAQVESARMREMSLASEMSRLSQVRDELREEFKARERLEELCEATDFIRDTLKQAGPLVTESYLYNISIEANQMFREITGEAGRSLRWSRDYEIMLEEGGYERAFPNLSGGEQMAAALSIRLAILKQLSDVRIAFFDEPTINMDAERRERLAEQIGQIGQVEQFDQLFVISHDDTFEESVDHIIHVSRKQGDSSVGVQG